MTIVMTVLVVVATVGISYAIHRRESLRRRTESHRPQVHARGHGAPLIGHPAGCVCQHDPYAHFPDAGQGAS